MVTHLFFILGLDRTAKHVVTFPKRGEVLNNLLKFILQESRSRLEANNNKNARHPFALMRLLDLGSELARFEVAAVSLMLCFVSETQEMMMMVICISR